MTPAPASRFGLQIVLVWLAAAAAVLAWRWHAIGLQDFLDADDQLRLVQVRDWLAGQSFQDVTQYRMNPPAGAPMHWSRLVDLPLAGLILLLRPVLGSAQAEIMTAAIVPVLTLGMIMVLAALIARRLAGPGAGVIAAIFCGLCIPLLLQTAPLRVDHHGWVTAFSMLALFGVLDRDGRRSGIVAGVGMAIALQISLEALPLTIMVGAALGFHWMLDAGREQGRRLTAYSATLLVAEALLTVIFRRPVDWLTVYCDSVTYAQLLAIGVMAAGALILVRMVPAQWMIRAVGLGATVAAATCVYHLIPPYCTLDAFSQLEPNVRALWYERVLEGLPVWTLPANLAVMTVGFPALGTLCAAIGWHSVPVEQKPFWRTYLIVMAGLLLIAVMVQRTGGLASAAAIPPAAWALVAVIRRIDESRSSAARVIGTVAAAFAFSPLGIVSAYAAFAKPDIPTPQPTAKAGQRPCTATEYVKALSILPPSRVLAPLDLGPTLLLNTPHEPVASGHHRNHAAMSEVITAFTSNADVAHAIVTKRGISFVILCPSTAEIALYKQQAPNSLAAQLFRKDTPDWLVRRQLPRNPLQVWQVVRQSSTSS